MSTMEGQSDFYEEVKVKGMDSMKKEDELILPPIDESSKEGVLPLPNAASRPTPLAASGPIAAIPPPDQLTIFYGGNVVVFDGIPAEKVREIMLIAASAVKPSDMKMAASVSPAANSPILTRSPSLQSATNGLPSPQPQHYPINQGSPLCKLQAELPIARRHSLQRFFEKRRDRLGSKNPYPTPMAEKKAEIAKPDFCAEVSADAGCFEKSAVPTEKEILPKVAANLS